ncbi:MAG TPA: class I SAM-dependent methyltransferase [Moraxellaceae bacterium]|nr:class I SAM-dependent methyltransferase [Moraxellaceae bacterium]
MNSHDTSSISFTAHYTGYVWHHSGLSDAHFATPRGQLYFQLLRPFEYLARCIIGSDIKTTLLQRHYLIDRELEALIATAPHLQVLEIACGLSPRGYRFTRRHAGLTYVEADLPAMVARKQSLLAPLDSLDARHRLVVCNILEQDTPESLEAVITREFNPAQPLVVITEGLVNYFDLDTISAVWQRMAHALRGFSGGTYLTDVYPEVSDHRFAGAIRAANRSLKLASRSHFCLHFPDDVRMRDHFQGLGFPQVTVFDPDREDTGAPAARGGSLVRVVRATARQFAQ